MTRDRQVAPLFTPLDRLHANERTCPGCGSGPGEWDAALGVFVCGVCSRQWRRAPGKRVPHPDAQPVLPGISTLTLKSEWPHPRGRRR